MIILQLGDPEGKRVVGKIFKTVNNDLYIDFGWKFHCVCPRPFKNGEYVFDQIIFIILQSKPIDNFDQKFISDIMLGARW